MILICDSGSTKADWILLLPDGSEKAFPTEGLNPVHLPIESLYEKISLEKNISNNIPAIKEVHFFGAGCGNEEGRAKMTGVLKKIFPDASLTVDNDLMAAAYATAGKDPGIISILGTGSNCCYFDGTSLHLKNFGLGYILGDEGSGAWFGKNFLRDFLYGSLPKNLSDAFSMKYSLDREKSIEAVYRKPNANLFLSSFMPFILDHKEDDFMKQFLSDGLNHFFKTNIERFQESTSVNLHFVGSVAAMLEEEIKEIAASKKMSVGKVLQRPIDGLAKYYSVK